jgi:hypothetical protein
VLNRAIADHFIIVKTKIAVRTDLAVQFNQNTLASKSNAAPSVARASQPNPTAILFKPGASLLRLTLLPFVSDTAMILS